MRCECGVAVVHVKVGAVTGLEARLTLQKGRQDSQGLLKLTQQALEQQRPPALRSMSFPPRGTPQPLPTPSPLPQVCSNQDLAGIDLLNQNVGSL